MERAEQSRRYAKEAERAARQALNPMQREAYEALARAWRVLAEDEEGAPPPSPAPLRRPRARENKTETLARLARSRGCTSSASTMAHRNPDRVPITMRYTRGKTVADMTRERWEVISHCRTCGLMMLVDLKLIVFVCGPNISLWNRKARCRRLLCGGVVEFHAKAPGMTGHEVLAIDMRLPDPTAEPRWISKRKTQDG